MTRSFHSRLTCLLREAQAAAEESAATGVPADEATAIRADRRAQTRANTREMLQLYNAAAERAAERGTPADLTAREAAMDRFRLATTGVSRRTVLTGAGATAAAAVAGTAMARPAAARAASQPRIMIVGAGAAGIRCAHKLWRRRGWRSTIYEWDDHPGGRIAALRGFFAGGQIAEMHGEFISSEHSAMLSLASRFSLGLDDTDAYPPGTNDTYWFNGRRYTQAQLNSDWQHTYYPVFHHAVKAVPWPQTYRRSNPTGRKWDAMSVPQWMSAHLPGGTGTRFGGLCLQDVLDEYGGDPGDQLLAVARNSDGSLTGTFSNGSSCKQVTADRFVFALPFSTLRRVDLSRAGLSRLKMTAIRRLGYGTNSKIIVQTTGRPWIAGGYTGNFYTDAGGSSGWELNYQVSNYSSPTALLLAFPAGSTASRLPAKYGLNFGTDEAPAPARLASDYLGYLDKILPGVTSAYNGRAYYKASTPSSPATRGWPGATRISAASTPRRTPRDTWRVRSPAARGWLASSDEQG